MCSMHMPGCVGCVSALHVPAATRLQQHTPKTKTKQTKIHSDECTAWHTWHAEKTSLGKAHTHTHTQAWRVKGAHACCGDDAPAAPARTHARTHARTCSTQRPDQGAKEKKKGGKGVTRRKRKKKGRGQGVQLVRLHWIGTISGRAPPPDALPCTAPAPKRGQGRWVVREEERDEVICCGQGTEQKGEGEAGEQSTVHQENAQKQPPANAHASAMHCHTPAMVA